MTKLVIYNLETDIDSVVLAAAHDWILEFARSTEEVIVFSTHVGKTELPEKVLVVEIGGGDFRKRFKAIWKLFSYIPSILKYRKDLVVFHHMSPRTLLILGPIYRAFGIPQGLWYSHSVKSLSLRVSYKLANKVFSSTLKTLPYVNKNSEAVGHGINATRFAAEFESSNRNRKGIVTLGRVAPIKNLEQAIQGLAGLEKSSRVLNCVGPFDEKSSYVENLKKISIIHGVKLLLKGPENYSLIPRVLSEFSMIFTGTPISVDKAVIEGAMCGCFVVTTSREAQELTGMSEIWQGLGFDGEKLSIESQIQALSKLPLEQESHLREKISEVSISKNSLENTVHKILWELNR